MTLHVVRHIEEPDPHAKPRPRPEGWPDLADAAMHGPIGEYVRAAEPYTEADPAAVLVTTLAMFGAAVNRAPHMFVGNEEHPARIFPLIVGGTSSGAKGTSAAPARQLLEGIDPDFMATRCLSGFGSGEALVDAVADPDPEDADANRDGRLLVFEGEFARVLRAAGRDGSTLSMTVRDAWDGRPLQARSRARTSVASNAHVVLIGHVTPEELRARLSEVESFSGFANRLLLILSARSKLLPGGGNVPADLIANYVTPLRTNLAKARKGKRMVRSPEAETLWRGYYSQMADDDPGGLLGATIARATPYVLRMSLLYALADGATTIEVDHLEAAWALWSYSRKSAEAIFGLTEADPVAEKLLAGIRGAGDSGLTRTQCFAVLSGKVTAKRIDLALGSLTERDLIEVHTEPTEGRPRTIYKPAKEANREKEGPKR